MWDLEKKNWVFVDITFSDVIVGPLKTGENAAVDGLLQPVVSTTVSFIIKEEQTGHTSKFCVFKKVSYAVKAHQVVYFLKRHIITWLPIGWAGFWRLRILKPKVRAGLSVQCIMRMNPVILEFSKGSACQNYRNNLNFVDMTSRLKGESPVSWFSENEGELSAVLIRLMLLIEFFLLSKGKMFFENDFYHSVQVQLQLPVSYMLL